MKNLNANVQGAGLSSIHKFPWKWQFSDIANVKKNGLNVFSCFSCGGGSSMGYKLAGYDVIGNVEIDPRVMEIYKLNNHPKYSYLMDVRDFIKISDTQLPEELFHLDILDGSPPCSVFSTAGVREKGWNIEKVFREGQTKQKLDDLFFYFIRIAEKLKPRVIIAENVSGLIKGNAKGYVNEIFKAFNTAGYKAQLFLLNSAYMGVPQMRERVFFIAQRNDQNFPNLKLNFNEKPIAFGEVRSSQGKPLNENTKTAKLLAHRKNNDKSLADINKRLHGKRSCYTEFIVSDDSICNTITAHGGIYRMCDGMKFSDNDFINVQTFPQDYDFLDQSVPYVCGMSVPPLMMAHVAAEIYNQWLKPTA